MILVRLNTNVNTWIFPHLALGMTTGRAAAIGKPSCSLEVSAMVAAAVSGAVGVRYISVKQSTFRWRILAVKQIIGNMWGGKVQHQLTICFVKCTVTKI